MLKNSVRCFAFLLIGMLATQASALADTIEGRVKKVGPQALEIVVYDPQGRAYPNALKVGVNEYTRFNGIRASSELRSNDPIGANIRQNENKQWYAESVTLFQDVNVRPATQRPSPTLRDTLGNPVVRGALLGAATGAIASSTSGGKAGKGALVGAGVGAAAGLFQNMFSGGGQTQNSDSSNN